MEITEEISLKVYDSMAAEPPEAPITPIKPLRINKYVANNKSVVALVRSSNRSIGLQEILKLLGGLDPVLEGLQGTLLLKPNCNTDDPFPASTHPDMVRLVAELLIEHGIPPKKIIIGDMSGKARGLPTKWTMENMGLSKIASDLGLNLKFFEEEEWVTVKHPKMNHWPEGVRIPRSLYAADRVISLPAMKTHMGATFTLSLKNVVGLTDAQGRDWLHNGEAINQKIPEMNLAYTTDLIILDGINCFITRGPSEGKLAEPGIIIAGGDRVAVDAVGVAVLKQLKAENIADCQVSEHTQLKYAKLLGLGKLNVKNIEIRASNPERDPDFSEMLKTIQDDLST